MAMGNPRRARIPFAIRCRCRGTICDLPSAIHNLNCNLFLLTLLFIPNCKFTCFQALLLDLKIIDGVSYLVVCDRRCNIQADRFRFTVRLNVNCLQCSCRRQCNLSHALKSRPAFDALLTPIASRIVSGARVAVQNHKISKLWNWMQTTAAEELG